ncbi:SRPBCC family protein [Telluria beijingensis]|uniref:SRPBCC family protein n=1 Tax=Telluria beijingensis TaxID=3068633 RepID=UPI002795A2CE|nr:SRPBCC family protein [Massilia sp. REN29]
MNDTNETNDTNAQAMNVGKWIGAAVAGALLMYAFDPERGAKRRAHARGALRDARDRTGDRLENAWHSAGDRIDSARLRASSAAARAGERLAGAAHAAGDRLSDASHRTRDRLEHARDRLADASYEAKERAHELAHDARDRARHAAHEARDRVEHAAHEAREHADYAADKARDRADHAAERARERADQARERLEQSAWSLKAEARSRAHAAGHQVREWTDHLSQVFGSRSPTLTNSALLGTGALGLVGLVRRSPAVALLGLGALAVLLRSDRGRHLVDSLRHRGAASQVEVENAIHIDAAPKDVFDAWSEVENFPRFMSHVTEVRDLGHRRSHWVVRGPGGMEYAWNAVMTEQSRPDRLSWRSEPGSEIAQEGTVTFEPSAGGTRVTVRMTYAPPAGALGHGIARMLGADPQRQMDDDLARMKQFIERGGAHYATQQAAPSHSFLH